LQLGETENEQLRHDLKMMDDMMMKYSQQMKERLDSNNK
jgi:hypothetical protein